MPSLQSPPFGSDPHPSIGTVVGIQVRLLQRAWLSPAGCQAAAQKVLIGAGGGQAEGFLPSVCGGGVLFKAEMQLADYDMPAGITSRNFFLGNGGQAIEAG